MKEQEAEEFVRKNVKEAGDRLAAFHIKKVERVKK